LTEEWLCCYIVYHHCLRFDRGAVHIVVILSTITVWGLTEEWFMLVMIYCVPLLFKVWQEWFMLWLLYFLPLLLNVWQRSGSCCCCYIVYHYCLMFDRGVIHVVFVILSAITILFLTAKLFMSLLYCLPLLFKVWQRSGSCCCFYIVYHYCLRLDRGVVHVVVILSTNTV
jgi:sugar phosphate permease